MNEMKIELKRTRELFISLNDDLRLEIEMKEMSDVIEFHDKILELSRNEYI
jgi:hypothetical protein